MNHETQGLFTHPGESYLVFDGKLVKAADDTEYASPDVISFTNNGLMHLVSNIKYQLSDQEIESVFHPGQATTMLGLLKYPGDDFQKSVGLNQLWYKDDGTTAHLQNDIGFAARQQYIIQKPDLKGTFSFRVPLKHIFGFCDGYDKVVYGFKHQLTLVRKGDNDTVFGNNAADAGKVVLTKLFWFAPMCFQRLNKNLCCIKQLSKKQVSQSGIEGFNVTLFQSPKREHSPGNSRQNQLRKNLAG